MNFLHLRFLQLITPNASISFQEQPTSPVVAMNHVVAWEGKSSLAVHWCSWITPGRCVPVWTWLEERLWRNAATNSCLTSSVLALTRALVLRWISSLLPTLQIYSEIQIYKNSYRYMLIVFLLLGFLVKGKIIRVGYWACSQSQSGLQ